MGRICWVCCLTAMVLAGQDAPSGLSARRLYYRQNQAATDAPPDTTPKVTQEAKKGTGKKKGNTPKTNDADAPILASSQPEGAAPVVPVSHHLGVRYNIVKVDQAGQTPPVEVSSDDTFKSGDCVAVRMAPNYQGYLYVFHQGSTGKWVTMLPSEANPEQPRTVQAFAPVQIPTGACFKFDENPGTEKLFIVVTERPDDAQRLNDTIRKGPSKPSDKPKTLPTTFAKLDTQIDRLRTQMASRDLTIEKVAHPMSPEEPPHSVYVTTASRPNQDLLLEISLRHQ